MDDDRQKESKSNEEDDGKYLLYEQIIDCVHFYIFHMYELGLRHNVESKDDQKTESKYDIDQDDNINYECIDNSFGELRDNLRNKRKKYQPSFARFRLLSREVPWGAPHSNKSPRPLGDGERLRTLLLRGIPLFKLQQ